MHLYNLPCYLMLVMYIGIPTINNLMATDNCFNVTTSWDAITGVCSNSVQYMVQLFTTTGNTIGLVVTNDTSYTFTDAVNLTSGISVTVAAFNEHSMGDSLRIIAQSSPTSERYYYTSVHGQCEWNLCVTSYSGPT